MRVSMPEHYEIERLGVRRQALQMGRCLGGASGKLVAASALIGEACEIIAEIQTSDPAQLERRVKAKVLHAVDFWLQKKCE